MRTLGIIGGIAPGSTIDYYRLLIAAYRERTRDDSYPPILINSIDLTRLLRLVGEDRLGELVDWLVQEIERLARAGAEVGLLASNTPHLVFPDARPPISDSSSEHRGSRGRSDGGAGASHGGIAGDSVHDGRTLLSGGIRPPWDCRTRSFK